MRGVIHFLGDGGGGSWGDVGWRCWEYYVNSVKVWGRFEGGRMGENCLARC